MSELDDRLKAEYRKHMHLHPYKRFDTMKGVCTRIYGEEPIAAEFVLRKQLPELFRDIDRENSKDYTHLLGERLYRYGTVSRLHIHEHGFAIFHRKDRSSGLWKDVANVRYTWEEKITNGLLFRHNLHICIHMNWPQLHVVEFSPKTMYLDVPMFRARKLLMIIESRGVAMRNVTDGTLYDLLGD